MKGKYFNILAPFTDIDDVTLLNDAGADELYCGYVTEELTEKWPLAFLILNRRGEGASFENFTIFKAAVERAKSYNLPVYVTINGFYTPEQYPPLTALIKRIESLEGVKGILVVDLGLLLFLKKRGFNKDIHISTLGTCFNSQTAYFYKNLGVQRVILDRQLDSREIRGIISRIGNKIDIELFIVSGPCGVFIDGFCNLTHCFERNSGQPIAIKKNVAFVRKYSTELDDRGCKLFERILSQGQFEVFDALTRKKMQRALRFERHKYWSFGCRICELYDLKEYPLKSLKIAGRGMDRQYNARLVRLVSQCLRYLFRKGISRDKYLKNCKDIFSDIVLENKRRCTKFDCYFPSP